MSFTKLRCTVTSAIAVCFFVAIASSVKATTLPITFESPTYSAGFLGGQDGWAVLAGAGATSNINVTATSPIVGLQSLLVNNNSNSSTGSNQRKALVSSSIGTAPSSISWLVRVDALGNNVNSALTTADTGVQFGLSDLSVAGSTPIGVGFRDDGSLGYIAPSAGNGFTAFSGNPTYNLGTVYRVELLNINTSTNTYDMNVLVDSSNALIASVVGAQAVNTTFANSIAAPSAGNIGTGNVGFYVARRGGMTGNAMIDNISVPEPSSIYLISFSICLAAGGFLRRRQLA